MWDNKTATCCCSQFLLQNSWSAKFAPTHIHRSWSLFLALVLVPFSSTFSRSSPRTYDFTIKILSRVLSCEFSKMFQTDNPVKHLWRAASTILPFCRTPLNKCFCWLILKRLGVVNLTPQCGFSKRVSSRERVKHWFFVNFNTMISHKMFRRYELFLSQY